MSHLFAAVLLLSSPGCPHEETTCLTPTEYVEVHLSTRIPGDVPQRGPAPDLTWQGKWS
jgi:hypothetical protein